MKTGLLVVVASVIAYFVYGAIVSLPNNDVNEAKAVKLSLGRYLNTINKEKSTFESLTNSDEWRLLEAYSIKREWPDKLNQGLKLINNSVKLYDEKIKPILEKDHQEDLKALRATLVKVKSEAKEALRTAKIPSEEILLIRNGMENKEQYYQVTNSLHDQALATFSDYQAKAKNASATYPKKSAAIQEKLKVLEDSLAVESNRAGQLVQEYESDSPDFIAFSQAYEDVKDLNLVLSKLLADENKALMGLDKSYIKVLADQKVDYYITVGRANWCEADGCYNGSNMRYPAVKVDADTANYFDQLTSGIIAKNTLSWGREKFQLYIPQNRWDALGIEKYYRWNRNEPYAEYWIESINEKTYHRYSVIEDGAVTTDSWQEVSNDYFWQHYNNLGMAIITKPLGYFEDEAIKTAEPVGLATIAEPVMTNGKPTGSNQYGEWRQDSSGNSFWFYYGMYRMLGDFGPGRYGYGEWRGYSQRQAGQPYYGTSGQYGTYGKSTYSNSRYRNSTFSKRNPQAAKSAMTGRRSAMSSSVRGAGASSRAKGPSGSGK